jgi:hypothetical protein
LPEKKNSLDAPTLDSKKRYYLVVNELMIRVMLAEMNGNEIGYVPQ